MAEQIDKTELRKEMSEQLSTRSKYEGLGATIAAELIIGFWSHLSCWGSGRLELLFWGTYEKWQQMRLPITCQNKLRLTRLM